MYSHTKRIGSLGRFGSRTGRKIREEVKKIEDDAKKNRCPNCNKKIIRKSSGIWECRSCSLKFAGGAYLRVTKGEMVSEE